MILGPPSVGRPLPSKIRPSMSCETGSLTVSPVKRTLVAETSSPDVPSNIWTTATPPPTSRTCPLLSSPLGVLILASSPYPTPLTCSTKMSGPDISRTVLYSRPASDTVLDRQFENFLEWYVFVDGFLHQVVVVEDYPYHIVGFRLVTVAVGGIVGLLHEEVFLNHLRSFQDYPLSLREGVGTNEHDDLAQFLVALEKIHCHFSQVDPFGSNFFRIPGFEGVEVEGVACQPVDGWEVASLGKFGIKSPEDLDNAESVLSDRFGKVAPRRRDGANYADGALL